jgi:hypothetical protein
MDTSRQCPVCGSSFPVAGGPGRPRVYCGDQCRWAAGHQERDRERHEQRRQQDAISFDDLLAWLDTQRFEPLVASRPNPRQPET